MADLFAVQFPQNVNTPILLDTVKDYYRPFKDKDFMIVWFFAFIFLVQITLVHMLD